MEGLGKTAQREIFTLAEKLIIELFHAALEPGVELVGKAVKSFYSWMIPSRENDTVVAIRAKHRADEEDREAEDRRFTEEARIADEARQVQLAREIEDLRIAEEDKIAKDVLQAAETDLTRVIEERMLAEADRVAKEARMAEERKIADEIKVADDARFAEEDRVAAEARQISQAREIEQRRLAEAERVAKEPCMVEERRISDETSDDYWARSDAIWADIAEVRRQLKQAREMEERRHAEADRIAKEARIAEEARQIRQAREMEERRHAEADRVAKEARMAEERKIADEIKVADDARIAEEDRVAEEARQIRQAREIEQRRLAEADRVAKEACMAEERRISDEIKVADRARIAEERRTVDENRAAHWARFDEERKIADEIKVADEARIAEEARQIRQAREMEERRHAEADRIAKEARIAEERRIAEGVRIADEARIAEEARQIRQAREMEGRRHAEADRIAKETCIAEERRIAEAVRIADEARIAEEARQIRQAREIEEQGHAEADRIAKETRIAQERRIAEAVKIADEARHIVLARETARIRIAEERRIADEARHETETKLARETNDRRNAAQQRIADEARESEQRIRLSGQVKMVDGETSMLRERVKNAGQRECESRKLKQTTHDQGAEINPIMWPSPAALQRSVEKTQYSADHFGFAVTGASGTGKSSLINVFLNLDDKHKNAAPTDVVETTSTLGRYPDPSNRPPYKWSVWYDLPGAGTQDMPAPEYFIDQSLFIFDIILVVFDTRFTAIDLCILKHCRYFGIPSFIIRSQADSRIRSCMKSNGYESGDDMEDVENLRRESRDHFVSMTRQNVARELEKAGLPQQKVYIVSCSKQFRKEYSAFTAGSMLVAEGTSRRRFVDEMDLIHDLMLAAAKRRCQIKPKLPASIAERKVLIGRLRTGQIAVTGVSIDCRCKDKKKDVQHVLLRCSLTQEVRRQAKVALGGKELNLIQLLYDEKGAEWAERIWQRFAEVHESTR